MICLFELIILPSIVLPLIIFAFNDKPELIHGEDIIS
jgi:hypothetical protein